MELKNIKLIYIPIFCLLVTTLSGCYDVLSNDEITTDEHTPRLVVDGMITTEPGPYYVQLSLTSKTSQLYAGGYTPVTDATITISDDEGNVDVLTPFAEQYPVIDGKGSPGSTWGEVGYYQTTTNMRGTPGKTYTLTVVYNGETYEATTTMPSSVPELELRHEDRYELPFIYFDEPQREQNYYMFYYRSFEDGRPRRGNYLVHETIPSNLWSTFSHKTILYNDINLPAKVERLDIYEGANYQVYADTTLFDPDSAMVEMHTVKQEVYDLFKAIEQQKKNDGGTFYGIPSNLPGNLSNGALGFFRASAISRKTIPFTR
ncbi:MAG TPA: hypothetical protein DCS93_10680 [Microscillaceae bacterium]|nr:hypothetical protein [Microscillaceae bacterium]